MISTTLLREMKTVLQADIDEWLGSDIPEEGTDDYARWRVRIEELNAVDDISDLIRYLEDYGRQPTNFFAEFDIDFVTLQSNSQKDKK